MKEWGFKPASIREWMFKIGSSFLRKRSAPLTFVVGPAFELVEPPDYEFLDHVVSAAFGPMLEAGAQLDPLPVANVLVSETETSVFGTGRPPSVFLRLRDSFLSWPPNSSSMPSIYGDVPAWCAKNRMCRCVPSTCDGRVCRRIAVERQQPQHLKWINQPFCIH